MFVFDSDNLLQETNEDNKLNLCIFKNKFMLANLIVLISRLLLYILVQVLVLKHLVLFDLAFCYLYIAFILFLPLKLEKLWVLFLGFMLGIFVDIFYDTLGIHTAACVLLAYLRGILISLYGLDSDDEVVTDISIRSVRIQIFLSYVIILSFFHHLMLFTVEANDFRLFVQVVVRSLASTLLTFSAIFFTQYLSYSFERRSR